MAQVLNKDTERTQVLPGGVWFARRYASLTSYDDIPIPVSLPSRDDAIAACIREFPNLPCWAWSYPNNDYRLAYDPVTSPSSTAGASRSEADAAKEARNEAPDA